MKKDVMKKWVKALRSGKYKQGQGRLKSGDNFCCLGVLCDISKIGRFDKFNHYLKSDAVLPNEVIEYSGMCNSNPDTPGGSLACLNDEGATFEELANIIEKHWKTI